MRTFPWVGPPHNTQASSLAPHRLQRTFTWVVAAHIAAFATTGLVKAEDPKPDAPKPAAAPKTILFLGDSITRAGGYVQIISAKLNQQPPANSWRVINHGLSSETVSNLSEAYHPFPRPCVLNRIDNELKQNKPDWVVACYGINCGIYHPYSEKRFDAYKSGMETLIKKVHAAGAHIILLTAPPYAAPPFPAGSDDAAKDAIFEKANSAAAAEADKDPRKFGYKSPFPYYDYVLGKYAKWLLTLDNGKDVWVVDVRGAMLPKVKETHGRDAIHPNGLGHSIMAEAFLQAWPKIQSQAADGK